MVLGGVLGPWSERERRDWPVFANLWPPCTRTTKQDGKPYILSLSVGPAEDDPRSQGYTIVSKSEFSSLEDMTYYDTECEAHAGVKKEIMANGCEGVLTVFFKPTVTGGIGS